MKTLTKAKIINWHYFWNQTIDFRQIVFLTGKNASGKSTLIDAIMLVLLGDTTGKYFNKAALEKSARTLKGYLRGEIGDTEDGEVNYLRSGTFTSYLALEFHDDVKDEYFVMGCVFDTMSDGNDERHFFYYEDKIFENEFVIDGIPMNYRTLKAYFDENLPEGKYRFFDSNRQYQDFLKRQFGGLKDKYFSLLKKACSFSPITDITSFITEYVCEPQENINLENLQENIFQYRKLQKEAEAIQLRVSMLEDIKQKFEIFDKQNTKFKVDSYIIERCKLENSKYNLAKLKDEIEASKIRIKDIDRELEENASNLDKLTLEKGALLGDKSTNNVAQYANKVLQERKDTENEIRKLENQTKDIKEKLVSYVTRFSKASSTILAKLKDFDRSFLDEDKERELLELEAIAQTVFDESATFDEVYLKDLSKLDVTILGNYRKNLNEFKNHVSSLSVSLGRTLVNLEKKIERLQEENEGVKAGTKYYDQTLLNIRDTIANELSEKYKKKIDVEIFADLIDIKDKSWSNAIEGFLYNQKFNLFVPPKYYVDAYKILARLLGNRYYPTSLVDQEKIIERNYDCDDNSLATEIITNHDGARAYTNFLIGRLIKTYSIEECRESGNGITKDCDLYRNFTMTTINPRYYQNSFIGRAADSRFIKEKATELSKTIALRSNFKALHNLIDSANQIEVMSSFEIENMIELISESSRVKGLKEHLSYLSTELSQDDNDLIKSIDKKLKNLDEDLKDINDNNAALSEEKGRLKARITEIQTSKMVQVNEEIARQEQDLATRYEPSFIAEQCMPILDAELEEGKDYVQILRDHTSDYSRLQYTLNNLKSELIKSRDAYCRDYHLSYDTSSLINDQFEQDYHEYKEVRLPRYQEQIEDSYRKAIQQFKSDFINKLRDSITDVEFQIANLNEALEQSSFGNDLYRFTVKPSLQYRRYYDMLKDEMFLEKDVDDEIFLEKYQDIMDELFKQIVDTGTERNSDLYHNVAHYTDFRSYLDFDLIVKNKSTNEEKRLSKMMKKSSGGETQTPFYISVLASFAQLYRVNQEDLSNTIRIIIFDEAFSKMDRERIIESVKLLRKFNLQVILSTPPEKIGEIAEYVDETLYVSRDKKMSCVLPYEKLTEQERNKLLKK